MNKQTLIHSEEKFPRLTRGLIRAFYLFAVLVCSPKIHRQALRNFLCHKNFVYQFRFSFWLFIQRFNINSAKDINFRPFTSLSKQSDIAQIILQILQLKPSSHDIQVINELDIAHYANDKDNGDKLHQHVSQYLQKQPLPKHEPPLPSANKTNSTTKKHVPYDTTHLDNALTHIVDVLNEHKVDYFLMSGTLLGLVRNKRPLKNDDIDIGLYADKTDFYELIAILQRYNITVDDIQFPYLIKFTLFNVSIDLFFHFSEDDKIWHGSIYHRWYNQIFSHALLEYQGKEYVIPDNYERYLEENYGDWKTPVSQFSIYLDCPNYRPQYNHDALVFIYKNVMASKMMNNDYAHAIHFRQCQDIVNHLC